MMGRIYVITLLLVITILSICGTVDGVRVKQVGNDIEASSSGVDVAGVSFLLDDMVLIEGVLFAYSAFFRSDKPIRFQVWRPQASTANSVEKNFKLVGETRVIPSVINEREDVYIEGKLTEDCVRLRTGDRLGVYFEEAPGAVAYKFDANHPMALGHTVRNVSQPVRLDSTVRFDTLTFPYDFSMSAYIDTELERYNDKEEYPTCPRGLLIPDYIAPTLAPTQPPTGSPGATGETGPRGPVGPTGPRGPLGATGPPGPQGTAGIFGDNGRPGATGVTGPMGLPGIRGNLGSTGATGVQGTKGDRGIQGIPGPPGRPGPVGSGNVTVEAASSTGRIEERAILYTLLIWVVAVTVALIAIYVIIFAARRRHERRSRQTSMRSTFRPSWMNALKEESETQYHPDTVSTSSSSGQTNYSFRPDDSFLPSFTFDPEPPTPSAEAVSTSHLPRPLGGTSRPTLPLGSTYRPVLPPPLPALPPRGSFAATHTPAPRAGMSSFR